jgi:hypothetical protein
LHASCVSRVLTHHVRCDAFFGLLRHESSR